MQNNSMKVSSRKFKANMKAPALNQKDILLEEINDLTKNITKLSYCNSDQKAQIIKEARELNNCIKQIRVQECIEFGQKPTSLNRLQGIVFGLFYTTLLFIGAVIFVISMF